ncbi:protein MTL1-like [Hibiscus syriacus]|uniref:protein MTL1-like n=1 Tax=Hibiscus syriacus TaxID=106335 RepID=UPI0019212DF0|nr:protein MTL1-like [Hibiscus syriacus]
MLPLPLKLVRQALTHHPFLLSQNTHHRCRRLYRHHHHYNGHDIEDEEDEDENDYHEDDVCNSKSSFYNFHCHSSKPPKPKSETKTKTPLLLFLPTREIIGDTYSLANIAREMGMDLHPTPSLSHIIFSFSSSSPSPSSSSSSSASSSALSLSSSFSMPLPTGAVLISFPTLSSSSLSHLRSFVSLSKGLFKLVFLTTDDSDCDAKLDDARNWDY